jgi:hypothetical protein
MKSAFQPDDLMAILDSIDDAVVKLDGQANFAGVNTSISSDGFSRLQPLAWSVRSLRSAGRFQA